MGFEAAKCPECLGDIQIPTDRESAKCMLCGKDLDVRAVLGSTAPSEEGGQLATLSTSTATGQPATLPTATAANKPAIPMSAQLALTAVALLGGVALLFGAGEKAVVPKPQMVAVHIEASPPQAIITIDGKAVPNPFDGEFPADPDSTTAHMVVTQADGYEKNTKYIHYRQGQRVSEFIRLESDEAAKASREQAREQAASEARGAAERLESLRQKVKGKYASLDRDGGCLSKGMPPFNRNFEGGTFAENELVAKADGCVRRWPGGHNDDTPLRNIYCCPK